MHTVTFRKMHGLGNDFMIIDARQLPISLDQLPVRRFAHRQLGVGFDQLLLLEASQHADFFCRILNADGSEAQQCGNGLRCLARYIIEQGFSSKQHLTIETSAGIFPIEISDFNRIRINMGQPSFDPSSIPCDANKEEALYSLHLDELEQPLRFTALSLGNPHAIIQVSQIETASVLELGSALNAHPFFPEGVNVGFMEVLTRQHICLRTFERGSGETYACGSNASAAVVAGIRQALLDQEVTVQLLFGSLQIAWEGPGKPVIMTGPAEFVYEGNITL